MPAADNLTDRASAPADRTALLARLRESDNGSAGLQAGMRAVAAGMARARGLDQPPIDGWSMAEDAAPLSALSERLPLAELGLLYCELLAADTRRRGGVHYTPRLLTDRLVAAALDPLCQQASPELPYPREPQALRDLRVCDPAMGSGAFLLAALDYLTDKLEDPRAALDCLYGIDSDPLAVELARLTLWLASDGTLERAWLESHLRVGDSLLDDLFEPFDAIVSNPPYVENKRIDKAYKQRLAAANYSCLKGLWDLSVPFVERCLQLLAPAGVMGLVLPNKLATRDFGEPLRRLLTTRHQLLELSDVSSQDLFGGAAVYPILLVARKSPPAADHRLRIECAGGSRPLHPRQARLAATPRHIWSLAEDAEIVFSILEAAGEKARSLGVDLGQRIYRPLGFRWATMLDAVQPEPSPGAFRFIGCGSLAPLEIDWDRRLNMQGRSFERCWIGRPAAATDKQWARFGRPQLLVRELARELTAAVDAEGAYAHLTGIYAFAELEPEFPLSYVAGLLNSDVLRTLYDRLFWNTHLSGGYLDFKGSYLALLPIVPAPASVRDAISELVEAIGDGADLWRELNQAINPLYGLPASWNAPKSV